MTRPNMNNRKNLSVGVLSITAVILFIAQFIPIQPALALESIKDRDYTLVTANSNQGGDSIYVTENRTGQMAVFSWDPGRRALALRGTGALTDAFK